MREAIGGTQLMYIVLIFLTIYVVFMAGVIQYGKVFRQKNAIINLIEQNEGVNGLGTSENTADQNTLYGYARRVGYTRGVKACYIHVENRGYIYKIQIEYGFQMPMVGDIPLRVKGETKMIDRPVTGANYEEYTNVQGIDPCTNVDW